MKKIILLLLLVLFIRQDAKAYFDEYGIRRYRFAVNLSNPVGLISKGGVGLEYRKKQSSNIITYTKYWGVYAGTQYAVEHDFFLKTRNPRSKNFGKPHEFFIYVKGVLGDASYESKKMSVIGDNSNIYIGPNIYAGAGGGFGKRYNYKAFFWSWKVGMKGCYLVDNPPPIDKNMYRLFFVTGPGSIIDLNFHFGIQF